MCGALEDDLGLWVLRYVRIGHFRRETEMKPCVTTVFETSADVLGWRRLGQKVVFTWIRFHSLDELVTQIRDGSVPIRLLPKARNA